MCTMLVWTVNRGAWTDDFARFTQRRLGIAPQPSEHRIASEHVRTSAASFTLERRMCDCDALVGLGERPLEDGETTAEEWLGWLRDLPARAPAVARLAVLRASVPARPALRPADVRVVEVGDVDEVLLRDVADGELLVVDYPRAPVP